MRIPFNKPYYTGKEQEYMHIAMQQGKLSGDGPYTKRCHDFFESNYGFKKALLTTSCTHALELAAILANIQPGDEVILPAYTFVSTANAFLLRGATLVFADSLPNHPNMDPESVIPLISDKTKAIVVVHYAGVGCEMSKFTEICEKYDLWLIEDAAQAIHSYYENKPLGTFGHMAAFSFHDTKNIVCGEGGLLVVNDPSLHKRAEIIREKGTNRSAFFRGEIDKYGWVDIGSSYLPAELLAAFLYAQLEKISEITEKRRGIWELYYKGLKPLEDLGHLKLPVLPRGTQHNAHIFYVVLPSLEGRDALLAKLKTDGIASAFHYLSLHNSAFFRDKYTGKPLYNSDHFTDALLRLPLFPDLQPTDVQYVIQKLFEFYNVKN